MKSGLDNILREVGQGVFDLLGVGLILGGSVAYALGTISGGITEDFSGGDHWGIEKEAAEVVKFGYSLIVRRDYSPNLQQVIV